MLPAKNKKEAEEFTVCFLTRIKEEMRTQNMSLVKMAEQLGCTTKHTICLFEQKKSLSTDKMVDMAAALGIKLAIEFKK